MLDYEFESGYLTGNTVSPLKVDHIRLGSQLRINRLSVNAQNEPVGQSYTLKIIKNPVLQDSSAIMQRERNNEQSMLTFYTEIPETQQPLLIGAECCDITGNVKIRSIHQILPFS